MVAGERGDLSRPALDVRLEEDGAAPAALAERAREPLGKRRPGKAADDELTDGLHALPRS